MKKLVQVWKKIDIVYLCSEHQQSMRQVWVWQAWVRQARLGALKARVGAR